MLLTNPKTSSKHSSCKICQQSCKCKRIYFICRLSYFSSHIQTTWHCFGIVNTWNKKMYLLKLKIIELRPNIGEYLEWWSLFKKYLGSAIICLDIQGLFKFWMEIRDINRRWNKKKLSGIASLDMKLAQLGVANPRKYTPLYEKDTK